MASKTEAATPKAWRKVGPATLIPLDDKGQCLFVLDGAAHILTAQQAEFLEHGEVTQRGRNVEKAPVLDMRKADMAARKKAAAKGRAAKAKQTK